MIFGKGIKPEEEQSWNQRIYRALGAKE